MSIFHKQCVYGLILAGIILSVLNFIPEIQASGFVGTTITMSTPEELDYYYSLYGEAYMYAHWLGIDLEYCLGDPFDCAIVI